MLSFGNAIKRQHHHSAMPSSAATTPTIQNTETRKTSVTPPLSHRKLPSAALLRVPRAFPEQPGKNLSCHQPPWSLAVTSFPLPSRNRWKWSLENHSNRHSKAQNRIIPENPSPQNNVTSAAILRVLRANSTKETIELCRQSLRPQLTDPPSTRQWPHWRIPWKSWGCRMGTIANKQQDRQEAEHKFSHLMSIQLTDWHANKMEHPLKYCLPLQLRSRQRHFPQNTEHESMAFSSRMFTVDWRST